MNHQTYQLQTKPRSERKITYFCRLCRKYDVKTRKAHLKNYHNANPNTVNKRSMEEILDAIFLENLNRS